MNIHLSVGGPDSMFSIMDGKKKPIPVSLSPKDGPDEMVLTKGKFQLGPNSKNERDVAYVFGQSGSGKSYFVVDLVTQYKKAHPKNRIFLFTTVYDVSTIDKIKGLKKIKTGDPEFLSMPFILEDFKNSIIIFDDVDGIQNKALKSKMWFCMSEILTKGRHYHISCVVTNHVATNGHDTKLILNEAQSITLFPSTVGARVLKYVLSDYLGMSRDEIARVKKLDSRAVTILKSYPKIILSEKEAFILRN